ncbi:metallophosphoesterase family protein [Winogradskyella eckloniae]|uniref:metallophosphoesterase family protein n=1 Tax=Winogradskyella eckloniae TaxID=1089306 RepID=UPI001565B8AC|nr:metallophosphoesterase family protein [Winogradskyella eckloniae]NRD19288.1 metallophosphoesterase family protein [Winogradskyella eckloniae]
MNKNITDIGHLTDKVLLFGGVYSNLQALEALITVAESEGILPENCICTGDIIGYCAQPEETIQTFKNWKARSIVGNVEIQLRDDEDDCGCDFREGSRCDNFSQQWYPYAKSKLSQDSLNYLETLPDHIKFTSGNKTVSVVHGSYFNVSEFIFKSTAWSTKQLNFEATQADIIIAGHCGLPFLEQQDDKLWVNPGVIGMPANDGNPNVWYAILDDSKPLTTVNFRKLDYDYKHTNQLMLNGLLPESYAKTIVTGIWDNMEILPETEKQLQGKPILL